MRYFHVKGYDRPLLLSEEHAKLIGASELQELSEPTRSASRQAWADYAESLGSDPATLENWTRAQLIENFGS